MVRLLARKAEDSFETLIEDVKVNERNAPKYTIEGREVNIWDERHAFYHSRFPSDYVKEKILECEKDNVDPFPDIVGKAEEKELVKNALLSSSPILFKGRKGYGKTTFSKSIAKLLPERMLAVRGCKINDDPTNPSCFSCKKKILEDKAVDLTWVSRIWVRVPGDPMLTSRQLVGGISIQKIREGFDLDHPEVFIPGRALKANRGVGYFDELGAIPSSLQTLLHELFEEHQVTTVEGDLVPFKINTVEVASTNPANYRGTSPIKEPLLDRMEEIEVRPPKSLEEEIEIGRRNMHVVKRFNQDPAIPRWHMEILARAVRYARDKEGCAIAKEIESEPSCRATIKSYDHIKSRALRSGRNVPLLADYGASYEIVKLAFLGRIEVGYEAGDSKNKIVDRLVEEAVKRTCRSIYEKIPKEDFEEFYNSAAKVAEDLDGDRYLPINGAAVGKLRAEDKVNLVIRNILGEGEADDELYLSAFEIALHSIAVCAPAYVSRKGSGYVLHGLAGNEA